MADGRFDVIVIGGGPGGYVAAIAAAQRGKTVACVENRGALGGTCLNVGCIPSKTLLHWSERYFEAGHAFAQRGIKIQGLTLDLAQMMADKDKVVSSFTKGIEILFRKHKVNYVRGLGRIAAPDQVEVALTDGGSQTLEAGAIVVATGSVPQDLAGIEVDEKRILTSTGALSLPAVPKSLVVIGAGYIGLELGSVWRRLGAEVTVVEFLDRICPTMDGDIAKTYQRLLQGQGLKFRLKTKVESAKAVDGGVAVGVRAVDGAGADTINAEAVLVAVGRQPVTLGLGLKDIGVAQDNKGFIRVDRRWQSSVPGIYAIGDVIPGPMLAHKAMVEGVAVAEVIAGEAGMVNYDVIPAVVYTDPEVAWVGKTEDELKAAGIAYKTGNFPFMANSRAKTVGQTAGTVKFLSEQGSDRVLGVHILGSDAGSLIAEVALAMEFGASAEDIARTCHAHPTLNEAVMEAASLAAFGKTIHL